MRCGIDLDAEGYRGTGAVVAVLGDRRFTASGLDDFASDWFTRGLLTMTSAAAEGQRIEVKAHSKGGGVVTLETWAAVHGPLVAGQTFVVTAGCDKRLATCKAKFANAVNFRGFPHMPGNDFVTSFAKRSTS